MTVYDVQEKYMQVNTLYLIVGAMYVHLYTRTYLYVAVKSTNFLIFWEIPKFIPKIRPFCFPISQNFAQGDILSS